MPLFRALAKNMAASYFGKKAPYGFVMEVTLLYVFILCLCQSNQIGDEFHYLLSCSNQKISETRNTFLN